MYQQTRQSSSATRFGQLLCDDSVHMNGTFSVTYLETETVGAFETLVTSYQPRRHHALPDSDPRNVLVQL